MSLLPLALVLACTSDPVDDTATEDTAPTECDAGYELVDDDCVDIDECADALDDCDPLAGCENTDGSYECGDCPTGYDDANGDSTLCEDIDECAEGLDDCDPLVDCNNVDGDYECGDCPAGYEDVNGDGSACENIDECDLGLDDCAGWELCSDEDPGWTCAPKPFDTSAFPLDLGGSNGLGQLSDGPNGTMLASHYSDGRVFTIHRDGTYDEYQIFSGYDVVSTFMHAPSGRIFASASYGQSLAEVDLTGETSTQLLTVSYYINHFALVPEGFGSYGGWVAFGATESSNGVVGVFDPADPEGTLTLLSQGELGQVSSLTFAADGTLYVLAYHSGLYTLTVDGVATLVNSNLGGCDGLVIDDATNTAYVADSSGSRLLSVDLATKAETQLGTITLDGGYYPTGMYLDGYGSLFYTGRNPSNSYRMFIGAISL